MDGADPTPSFKVGTGKGCKILRCAREELFQIASRLLWTNKLFARRRQFNCYSQGGAWSQDHPALSPSQVRPREVEMAYKETFWMACDSTEQMRAEYGPFHTRAEAEREARKLGFGYLLRYEHIIGDNEDIQEVRCIFVELPPGPVPVPARATTRKLHPRCATCGESAIHDEPWQAEVWADIHEFEHSRHRVRLFEQTPAEGLREIADWRDTCA